MRYTFYILNQFQFFLWSPFHWLSPPEVVQSIPILIQNRKELPRPLYKIDVEGDVFQAKA